MSNVSRYRSNLQFALLALLVVVSASLSATPAAAQTYSYDAAGRLTRVTYADGTTIVLTLDAAGNVTSNRVTAKPPGGGGGGGGGGCFIATAAYGSPLHPHVASLRVFRDEWLLTNAPGRAFVELYYATSPPVADVIAEYPVLRGLTRVLLAPLVFAVVCPREMLVLLLAAGALVWMRRRARRHGGGPASPAPA